jgi:hypothetical protein
MKPIILVILGAAMLMPMMRQSKHNSAYSKPVRKERKIKHTEHFEVKEDTEATIHGTGFWIERLP